MTSLRLDPLTGVLPLDVGVLRLPLQRRGLPLLVGVVPCAPGPAARLTPVAAALALALPALDDQHLLAIRPEHPDFAALALTLAPLTLTALAPLTLALSLAALPLSLALSLPLLSLPLSLTLPLLPFALALAFLALAGLLALAALTLVLPLALSLLPAALLTAARTILEPREPTDLLTALPLLAHQLA